MLTARPRQEPPQQMTIPPIIMQMPTQQPQLPWYNGNGHEPNIPLSNRTWDVIGAEDN